jgi:hypothetical protein
MSVLFVDIQKIIPEIFLYCSNILSQKGGYHFWPNAYFLPALFFKYHAFLALFSFLCVGGYYGLNSGTLGKPYLPLEPCLSSFAFILPFQIGSHILLEPASDLNLLIYVSLVTWIIGIYHHVQPLPSLCKNKFIISYLCLQLLVNCNHLYHMPHPTSH